MICRWIVCVLAGLVIATPLAAETPATKVDRFGKLPLVFEPNRGQTDSSVRFLSRGDHYGLFLTDKEAIVSLSGPTPALVRMQLVGQNAHPQISGAGTLPGTSNYYKGSVASKWQESVPHFLRVNYREVYPGIDLTYYGNQRQLEYDFTVRPHANPKSIELKFSGVDQLEISAQGDLILHTAAGEIRHQHPRVFQERNHVQTQVDGQFALLGDGKVGFHIGAYDSALPLVIDPKFEYSTYFGGAGNNGDVGIDVKVDGLGQAYVTGYTSSMDFFATNLSSTAPGGGNLDAFVMKVDATGTIVQSAVFFGGSGDDEGHRIALDSLGNVYVTGYTKSSDFPIVNGFQTHIGGVGRKDAYIAKINNAVSQILFSSYLGGSLDDQPFGLSVDVFGNIYIAGETISPNFPLVRPLRSGLEQTTATDAFVTKISPDGTIVYSSYLGGKGADHAWDVTSDPDGNAYVVGFTSSCNFPGIVNGCPNAFTFANPAGAFITKINADGSAYVISRVLDGNATDEAVRVVLDSDLNIIISGYTNSVNFPVKNSFQPANAGGFDIFVAKVLADFSDIVFSTFIGSDGNESAPGLAVDAANNIYIAGYTSSFSFPVLNGVNIGTTGGTLKGDRDAYVMKIAPSGRMMYSTYVGGSSSDGAIGLAVDAGGSAYVTGYTFSTDFPVVNGLQSTANGASDGFLLKINGDDVVLAAPLVVPGQGAVTLSTIGGSNSVSFAHASFEVPAGAKRPAGMAILDLRQGGAEVGEVAFPLLPFITDGRIYVNESTTTASNLSVVNPLDQEVTLYFFFTDRAGNRSNSGSVTIPPKASFAQPVTGAPFRLSSTAAGVLTFGTATPIAAMAFRTFSESNGKILITYLPIIDPYHFETQTTTIPQFAADLTWTSEFLLVNNTETPMTGEVRFFNNGPNEGDPTLSSTPIEVQLDRGIFSVLRYSLGPLGSDNFATSGLPDTVSGYVQIVPDAGTFTPVATEILTYFEGVNTLHATVEAQVPGSDFRLYDELNGDFNIGEGHATAMAFAISNPSDTPTDITMTLVNMDGTPAGFSTAFTLPAKGHIAKYLHSMNDFKNMPNPFQGTVRVHATGPGVTLFGMRGRISENSTFIGTTTGPIKENAGSGTSVIFPHILDGGGYATQFILFGDPAGGATMGTLSFADENGESVPLAIK